MRLLLTLFALLFPVFVAAQDLGTVNFDFDSDVLDAEARAEIAEIAEDLKASPTYKPTVVVGYTDAVGSSGYNQDLGLRRARAVARELVAQGVPVERIGTVESRGENELLVSVSAPLRANRRATVTLDDMLAACRSYRDIAINSASVGDQLQNDLRARLAEAVTAYAFYEANGRNGPAFQMAGAAREDCGIAIGYVNDSLRKVEYAQRCICNSTRLRTAMSGR
ncbi:OmpA family protein [Cognatiyoonia sediminum]|uniref:OmpA family protein n=1 Tax=Cognatiyoonia sediminum TaxID=1508389 RepID=A0A1M5T5N7_9RHOB|nr:OmpA family protein [Cognatiyoonia sediminum]SHH46059.1 OmpA family protein [Cognatiyoonia sediminum]